jgi:hypothetical protein
MSGNWIKMGVGLRTHPKVVRMASALKADRLRVIGGLHAVWSIFDAHTEDGFLEGYTHQAIDDDLGWKGFSKAMQSVGWLDIDDKGAHVPEYADHNGATAKRRAMETKRKESGRTGTKAGRLSAWKEDKERTESGQMSASDADTLRAREEKRREEETSTQEVRGESLGARLPTHWLPGETLQAWTKAERQAWGDERIRLEVAQFVDHYTGTGDRRADWDATWRKWVRTARDPKAPAWQAEAQAPAAAAHSVDRAREVIVENRAAARTAVPMPEAIRALLPKIPKGDDHPGEASA